MNISKLAIVSAPSRTCPDCNGSGYDFGDGGQCDTCSGLGEVK